MNKLILQTRTFDEPRTLADNIILSSDAYKMTHWVLYPKGTEKVYSYLESRGTDRMFDSTLFFGLQIYLKRYLEGVRVKQWMMKGSKF